MFFKGSTHLQGTYSTRHMTIQEPGHPPSTPNRVPHLLLYWSLLKRFRALVPPSWVKAGVPPSQKSGDVAVLEPHSMDFSPMVGMDLEFGTLSSPRSLLLGLVPFKLVRKCSLLGTTALSGLRHGGQVSDRSYNDVLLLEYFEWLCLVQVDWLSQP